MKVAGRYQPANQPDSQPASQPADQSIRWNPPPQKKKTHVPVQHGGRAGLPLVEVDDVGVGVGGAQELQARPGWFVLWSGVWFTRCVFGWRRPDSENTITHTHALHTHVTHHRTRTTPTTHAPAEVEVGLSLVVRPPVDAAAPEQPGLLGLGRLDEADGDAGDAAGEDRGLDGADLGAFVWGVGGGGG